LLRRRGTPAGGLALLCLVLAVPAQAAAPAPDPPPQAVAPEAPPVESGPSNGKPRASLLRRWLRPLRGGTPTFEMHVVPRAQVEAAITRSGGSLLHAIDDGAAGYRWLSYTYVARKDA